jgi:hypothetical protein
VNAHLILNTPQVWGINDGTSLEEPLDTTTSNPMCAGKSPENNGVINFVAGKSYNFDITCGEKNINAPGCLIGDWHSGNNANDYPGCALSVSYNGYNSQDNFKYISYSEECGKRGTHTSFIISKNIKNCENCICSWSLAPSRDYSSPGQFYHNCFYCSISGGTSNSTMRTLDFINIKGAKYRDTTYKEINPSNIYTRDIINSSSNLQQDTPEQQYIPEQEEQQDTPEQQYIPEQEEQQDTSEQEVPEQQYTLEQEVPEQVKNNTIEYELFKEFREYQKFKKYKELKTDDCDKNVKTSVKLHKRHNGKHNNHHHHKYKNGYSMPMTMYSVPTTSTSTSTIRTGKVCRYKTITRTICKPTNIAL